ncbi:unnamed protein product [Polarella glacialis]|uniref:Uncharacterized protein n=1 Tax=Polarella glacialis TaxID=89957 RepID=A0A813G4V7_POLGL|nr:unnamed protein product [Polarella glacialis]
MARRGSVLGVVDLSQGVGWWVNSDPKPPASPGGASAASTHIQGDDVERRQLNHGRTIATTSLDHVVWPGLSGLSPATTQSVMIASRAAALSTAAKRYQPIINQWIPRKMDGERLRGLAKPKPRKSSKDALLELEQASVQVRSLDVVRLVALSTPRQDFSGRASRPATSEASRHATSGLDRAVLPPPTPARAEPGPVFTPRRFVDEARLAKLASPQVGPQHVHL